MFGSITQTGQDGIVEPSSRVIDRCLMELPCVSLSMSSTVPTGPFRSQGFVRIDLLERRGDLEPQILERFVGRSTLGSALVPHGLSFGHVRLTFPVIAGSIPASQHPNYAETHIRH